MKKIIIITAILLFAISAHAQRTSKERTQHEPERQKSETIVRRSAEQKQNSRSQQATTTRQASTRDISNENRSQTLKSTYEKPQRGQVYTNNTGPKGRTEGDRTPNRGNTGTYNGNKPSPSKGTAGRYNGYKSPNNDSHRNNQSVRGNTVEHRKHYTTPNRQAVRSNHVNGYHYNPVRYRNVNYHYRVPNRVHVTWSNRMYHDYRIMYPEYRYWYYPIGYQIITVPSYNAYYHIGEVRNVYGRVNEVYYSWTTDEYHLYFGRDFPYHDFTVIIPGTNARWFDRYPEMFFQGRYMWVTGLLSTFEGRPELIVKIRNQIHLY
jgi:hypothetical protein